MPFSSFLHLLFFFLFSHYHPLLIPTCFFLFYFIFPSFFFFVILYKTFIVILSYNSDCDSTCSMHSTSFSFHDSILPLLSHFFAVLYPIHYYIRTSISISSCFALFFNPPNLLYSLFYKYFFLHQTSSFFLILTNSFSFTPHLFFLLFFYESPYSLPS